VIERSHIATLGEDAFGASISFPGQSIESVLEICGRLFHQYVAEILVLINDPPCNHPPSERTGPELAVSFLFSAKKNSWTMSTVR